MHGYRDHCIREAYPTAPQFYCPYSMYELPCPYCGYRQKVEEYPAQFHKRPTTPPPSIVPKEPTPPSSITPSTLAPCAYKYTYLWLKDGEAFWAYIVAIGRKAVSGWRYTNGHWRQFGKHLAKIRNFTCS